MKKYDEHPLGKLTDNQLDKILEQTSHGYSETAKKNIVAKTNLKRSDLPNCTSFFNKDYKK